MLAKKNSKYDLNKNSTLFFSLGLLCMTTIAYFAIEMKLENKSFSEMISKPETIDFTEDPIVSFQIQKPAIVPVKPVQFTNDFIIVEKEPVPVVITHNPVSDNQNVNPDAKSTEPSKPTPVYIEPVEDPIVIYTAVSETPVFPGCDNLSKEERDICFKEKIMKHIQKNLKYPENALENNHHGRVNVQFIIEKDGSISIANLRGPFESLNKEASRVIQLLPKMKPGAQSNKPVKVSYVVPILFKNQN